MVQIFKEKEREFIKKFLSLHKEIIVRSNKPRHDALVVQWIEHGSPKAEI